MSFLSSLKSAVFKVGATITKPAPIIATAVTSPIAFIKNPKAAVEKFVSQPITTQVIKGAVAGVTLGTGITLITGGVKSAAATLPVKAIKAIIPSTTKGKVIAGAVALPVYGAVTSNPIGAAKAVEKTAVASISLGETIANPSLENIKSFVTEHPIATGAVAVGAAALVAKTVVPAIVATRQTEAIQEQTEAIQAYDKAVSNPVIVQTPQITQQIPLAAPAAVVSTAAGLPVSGGAEVLTEEKKPVKKAKKKKSKAKKKATKKKSKKKAKKKATKKKSKKKAKKKATKKKSKKKAKKKTIKRRKSYK